MEKEKIDRVIDAFRSAMYQEFSVSEEVPTNSASGGQVAGLPPDQPPVKLDGRKKQVKNYINNLMKKRKNREEKKSMRKVMNFNPYFGNGKQ
tara:strand:- start:8 stop:283 length:276 start_codon:yes stop_codon:yes gene_type:complete